MAIWTTTTTTPTWDFYKQVINEEKMKDDGVRPTVDYREETVGKVTLFTQQHVEGYRVAVLVDGVVVYTTPAYETGEQARKVASQKVARGFQRLVEGSLTPESDLPF